jgi:hypothetical protein
MRKIQPLRKSSFISRVMRAIGRKSGFELHLPFQEKSQTGVSKYYPHYGFQSELRNAVLEAERQKAKSIMDFQRRNSAR